MKDKSIRIRLTDKFKREIEARAKAESKTVSEYVCDLIKADIIRVERGKK